ncbi:MAG: hypothetical protein K0S82_67 [Gaiellaceae bacterium]|jgi:hypothetical protein|nr:hypothetical protein [Gaiellaceae bacterium]
MKRIHHQETPFGPIMVETVACDRCEAEKVADGALMGWIQLEPMGLLRTQAMPSVLHFCSDTCARDWLSEVGLRRFGPGQVQ